MLSCGGGDSKGVELRFSSIVDAPYFTAVEVRISGEEFDPILVRKEGMFYPGDVVEFNTSLPEGAERHFEAIVYDPKGKPVYYGATTEDVGPESRVVVELHPSAAVVRSFLRFADSGVPAGAEFFILNEDLFTGNGPERVEGALDTYLTGSYVAYMESDRSIRYVYSYGEESVSLYREEAREFSVLFPQGETSLYLSGSYEGVVYGGEGVATRTGKVLSDGTVVLSGIGNGIHFFAGVPVGGVVVFEHSTCVTLNEPDCLPLRLTFPGVQPERVDVLGVYRSVEFLASRGGYFWSSPELGYRLRVYGSVQDGGCSYNWRLERDLPEGFSGEGAFEIGSVALSFPQGLSGRFRIYGEGLEVEGFCEGTKEIDIPVFESLPPGTHAEVERGSWRIGVLVEGSEVTFPDVGVRDVVAELRDGTLLFKFRREGELADCSLTLVGRNHDINVDRIPVWRSYVKVKDVFGIGFEDEFGEFVFYILRCYSPDGRAYISVEPFENPEIL